MSCLCGRAVPVDLGLGVPRAHRVQGQCGSVGLRAQTWGMGALTLGSRGGTLPTPEREGGGRQHPRLALLPPHRLRHHPLCATRADEPRGQSGAH